MLNKIKKQIKDRKEKKRIEKMELKAFEKEIARMVFKRD